MADWYVENKKAGNAYLGALRGLRGTLVLVGCSAPPSTC